MTHYIVIMTIGIMVVCFQIYTFIQTRIKIKIYRTAFFYSNYDMLIYDAESATIETRIKASPLLRSILDNLNLYLRKNKEQTADYHLMKDIVERNCEVREDEINTQIPFPLYYGLMGTIAGILIGIGFLVFAGGGLDVLGDNLDGINNLLGGIAIAMASSIVGILLTTWGANCYKEAKKVAEEGKDKLLSWVQTELLPELSSDISGVLTKMTQRLSKFNTVFSENTSELKETLSMVNDSYKGQAEVLKAIQRLDIGGIATDVEGIATANVQVYEKLQKSTDAIDRLGQYLYKSDEYLQSVLALNKQLGDADQRSKTIEEMGIFFKKELSSIEQREVALKATVGNIDDVLAKSLEELRVSSTQQIDAITHAMGEQTARLDETLSEQQTVLKDKLAQMLSSVEEHNANLKALWNEQREALSSNRDTGEELQYLSDIKKELSRLNTTIISLNNSKGGQSALPPIAVTQPSVQTPLWLKITVSACLFIVTLYCLPTVGSYFVSLYLKLKAW